MNRTLTIVGAAALTLVTTTGAVQAAHDPRLPAPTGKDPVGMSTLHLVDSSRPDPWNPAATARELLVSVWYPAKKAGGKPVRYLTPRESELILEPFPDVPPEILSRTRTHATTDAVPRKGRLPLVLMSPGFSWPRATMTTLAEDLASRGYLVAAVEHTYEAVATFPDGRTTTCLACVKGQDLAKVAAGRVKDVRFVLDEVKKRWRVGEVAMVGMSAGGNSTAHAMLADRRIKAGVNLDGTFKPVPGRLTRPFLLFGNPVSHEPTGRDETWGQAFANMKGWKRWLTVDGSVHASFSDYGVLQPQIGLPGSEIGGPRGLKLTRTYVGAFLDRHLRGAKAPLLDRPEDSEVKRWK
ncbi:alpha/beta hydrolase family protein [Nonomuraea sp. NPDC050790]|uniref:alpha/beta hydrolase family protein n=1 Tax=Nonomuraea sp. NPDC050790 TaxID=3364371 RepID=UPI0037AF1629